MKSNRCENKSKKLSVYVLIVLMKIRLRVQVKNYGINLDFD